MKVKSLITLYTYKVTIFRKKYTLSLLSSKASSSQYNNTAQPSSSMFASTKVYETHNFNLIECGTSLAEQNHTQILFGETSRGKLRIRISFCCSMLIVASACAEHAGIIQSLYIVYPSVDLNVISNSQDMKSRKHEGWERSQTLSMGGGNCVVDIRGPFEIPICTIYSYLMCSSLCLRLLTTRGDRISA